MASLTISCNCGREDSSVIVGTKGWLRVCFIYYIIILIMLNMIVLGMKALSADRFPTSLIHDDKLF